MNLILLRLSRALIETTLAEALEETGPEAGDRAPISAADCARMLEDLRLARSSAENSIKDAGCYSRKRMAEMENAARLLNKINNK